MADVPKLDLGGILQHPEPHRWAQPRSPAAKSPRGNLLSSAATSRPDTPRATANLAPEMEAAVRRAVREEIAPLLDAMQANLLTQLRQVRPPSLLIRVLACCPAVLEPAGHGAAATIVCTVPSPPQPMSRACMGGSKRCARGKEPKPRSVQSARTARGMALASAFAVTRLSHTATRAARWWEAGGGRRRRRTARWDPRPPATRRSCCGGRWRDWRPRSTTCAR